MRLEDLVAQSYGTRWGVSWSNSHWGVEWWDACLRAPLGWCPGMQTPLKARKAGGLLELPRWKSVSTPSSAMWMTAAFSLTNSNEGMLMEPGRAALNVAEGKVKAASSVWRQLRIEGCHGLQPEKADGACWFTKWWRPPLEQLGISCTLKHPNKNVRGIWGQGVCAPQVRDEAPKTWLHDRWIVSKPCCALGLLKTTNTWLLPLDIDLYEMWPDHWGFCFWYCFFFFSNCSQVILMWTKTWESL